MVTKDIKQPFYLGDWCVIPEQCRLQNNEASNHIQPKLMEVLLYFAQHPGKVVSTDELIGACWMGQPMTDNPIHKSIAQLRKALGDSSDAPKYLKTIPRKGYILVAKVSRDQTSNNQTEAYWCDQSPFLGNHAFNSQHQAIFFGRQQAIDDMLTRIERLDHHDNLMINVSGVSGCGKSSLIQAGIIPQLLKPQKSFSLKFEEAVIWQASENNNINDLLKNLFVKKCFNTKYSIKEIQQQWQQKPNELTQCLKTKGTDSNSRVVLFLDQIETWLDLDSNENSSGSELKSLYELILLLNSSKHFFIILSARDEAREKIKKLPMYSAISASSIDFRLSPLKSTEQKNWIQATMQAAGLFFEVNPNRRESLLDLLSESIENLHCSFTAIQIVLLKLYESKDNSKIQYASFHKLGGIEGIMNTYYEACFQSYSLSQKNDITALYPKLIAYLSMLETKPIIRQIPLRQANSQLTPNLLQSLIDQRLLKSEHTANRLCISFNEPGLPLMWFRVTQWITDNKSHLLKQSEIQFMTARWILKHKRPEFLMTFDDLNELQETEQQSEFLTEDQQHYLTASSQHVTRGLKVRRGFKTVGLIFIAGMAVTMFYGLSIKNKQHKTQQQLNGLVEYITTDVSPKLKSSGQLSLLESTHTKLLQVIKASTKNNPSEPQTKAHAAALNVMGELSFNHRNPEQALSYFSQSESLISQTGDLSDPALLAHLMLSQYWLGYLGFVDNQFVQAKGHWQSYLDTSLRLRELEPENTEWQLEHSYALNNLGSLSEKTGEFQQAADYFAQSIAIKSNLLRLQTDNMSLQADLADSLSWQGNIYRKQGALKLALTAYQDSAELTEQMKTTKANKNIKLYRVILATHRMATLVLDMGDIHEAQKLAQSALDKSLLLNELDSQNNDYKREMISLHLFNGHIYRHLKAFDSSLQHIQKANQLIDYFKINLSMTSHIAAHQMHLKREQALIFQYFGQIDSAKTALEEGLMTWHDYELSQNQNSQISFAMIHLNMAQILQQEKPSFNAQAVSKTIKNHLDKARQEIDFLLSQNPADRQLMAISLAISYTRTGENNNQEYIQALTQSEYRNPEYYQPLIEHQLLTLN